ncbi:RNA-directed DNA polymerase from mobile element jockey-like isoform X1 [Rhizophagus clarus]|uniref:RNA-directed DNA polymerase from mobile element jockey-like isoform X1 n=1 Tax=Rhizophagus clarus TaxID=94130 RepID=A0A8H3LIS2_9GLOM|nr:RNA-directed DNA polymerase from mobile element jockey-like isoform X1 [Rhizophagus clarus]
MHAKIEEDAPITYDAYVKLSNNEEYFAVDNKVAYVELLTRDFRGFLGTEINKEDNEIIIKNSSYKGMLHMVRLFNHKCRSHPFLRMHQKTYFLVDGMRVSSKEFKILNVPKHLSRDTIEQAVTKLLGSRRFFIKKSGLKPSKNNPDTITVFITVKDLDKCKQLKDIWSIEIDRILYRFAPAHAKDTDIVSRKKYSGEFVGFDNQTTPAAVQEAYTAQNPCHVYRQSDDKFIIEFSTECDLFNACAMTVHFNNYRITGSPRDYNINWSARNKKLAKIPTIRPPSPDKRVSITHQEDRANAVALGKRINSTIITNPPSMDISDTSDTSSSSNSLTNHKDGIVEGARIIFNNNNLDCMDHSINFINLKIGFHNINGLASDPNKLKFLLEWCHANNFDFMGIAETNSHCINLQHFIKDTYDDCSYDLAGSPKSIIKPKGSGVALLIHSKWQKFHFDTKIFSPYLMVSKFGTKHRQLWIWVYYFPPTDKQTLRTFEQIMNNTTFLNPEAKEFSWHQRSQNDTLRIDTRIDHIWIQRHITPSLRFAHHYDGHTLTGSDHDIVVINLYLPDIFPIAYKHTQPITPHDPNFRELSIKMEDITSEHWTHILDSAHRFALLINALHNIANTSEPTDHPQRALDTINNCWADIKDILMSAAAHTLPLRKRNTTHPRLKPKDKPADMNKLERHTAKLFVFLHEIYQYQVTTPHNPAVFFQLKDRWESQILLFNKDYADDRDFQFDSSFLPDFPDWLDQLNKVAHKRKKAERKAFNSYQSNKITAAVEARFAIIQSDQTRWISSSLDQCKSNVSIDRLMVTSEDGLQELLLHPDEVRQAATNAYVSQFRKRNSRIDSLDAHPIWKNAYEPILKANEHIYESIEKNFTLPFWITILQNINKNSAPGTSGITYQLMCHLPPTFVEVILALYRTIFLTGLVPADWKFSIIFPIPKPEKFEYNMANVRPIALLEVVRKIFTKFISTQLSDILQDHNVLCYANYCGLKGESTASPIRLINNLIEDAKENSKELWIVLQDISKAFDSISLDFLDLALKRISLPSHAVNCIINLFKGRTVQVATAFGPSPSFQAADGIDQEDSLSPLLWRIYYDPLLATITALPTKGYNMECVWPHNPFYELVDININHKKCELIVINPSLPRHFLSVSLGTHERDTIHPIQTEARYLGVWISPKNTRSLTKQRLRRTRGEFLHTIQHKKLSLAHVVYLINKVLYPKLIYLSQFTTFTKPEWDAIERPILALVKHTIGVQRFCPNSALYHEGIVELHCLWMVVSTAGIMNLYTVLNDHNDATFTTLLRLRQAQLLMKLPDCCFSVHSRFRSLYMAASRSNLALFYLLLASDLYVNIKLDQIDRLNFSIKNIEFPLLDIWSKSYNVASITRINNKHSQFPLVDLSQLIAGDGSSLMTWKQYRTLAELSRKGPKAKWFTQLESSVLASSDSRYLLPEYRSTQSTFYITRFLKPPSQDDGDYHQPHGARTSRHEPMDCLISIPHDQRDDNIWINRWIGSSDDKDHLIEIKDSLNSVNELSFYTDGSVQNGVLSHLRQRLDDCLDHRSMVINQGAAFVETSSNLQFFTRLVNWPSSTSAELFAILLALLVCPRDCRVKIYTDSNCSISTITRFLRSRSKFCSRGFNNSLILIYIGLLIRDKNLDLELIKVKAHAGDPWNDLADELAKKGAALSTYHQLSFNFGSQACRFSPHFEDTPIEQKLRNFLSTMGTVQSCSE